MNIYARYMCFILFTLGWSNHGVSQLNKEVLLIDGPRVLGEGFKKWSMDFVLDSRNSFIHDREVRVGGLRIGMEYNRVNRFGLGFYGLSNNVEASKIQGISQDVETARYAFDYTTLYFERVLWFSKKWEFNATAQFGKGTIELSYLPLDGEDFIFFRDYTVYPAELSVGAYYNIWWWVSFGGGFGYRYLMNTESAQKDAYNSSIYLIKLKIRIGKMVRAIWNKDVKNEY